MLHIRPPDPPCKAPHWSAKRYTRILHNITSRTRMEGPSRILSVHSRSSFFRVAIRACGNSFQTSVNHRRTGVLLYRPPHPKTECEPKTDPTSLLSPSGQQTTTANTAAQTQRTRNRWSHNIQKTQQKLSMPNDTGVKILQPQHDDLAHALQTATPIHLRGQTTAN